MSLTWQDWAAVSEGSTTPGAPIAAVPWGDTYALFLSDPHGGIYGIKATPGFGWENVPGLTSAPGASITALATGSEFVLFVTNAGGEVFTTTGAPYKGWSGWVSVSQGSTTPGAPIAAVPWGDTYALFLSDPHGGIYGIKATPGFGWQNVPGLTSKPGAPIAALSWHQPPLTSDSALDPSAIIPILLFTTNADGDVVSTSGLPYQDWQPWSIVGDRVAPLGAAVTVAHKPTGFIGDSPFSVFVANPGGEVFATTSGAPPTMPQLTVTGVTESTINVAWTETAPTSAPLTGFTLIIQRDGGAGQATQKGPNELSAVYTGLDAGTKYQFFQYAYSDNGFSPVAMTSTTTLSNVVTPPPVPSITCNIGPSDSIGDKALNISGDGFEANELVALQITILYYDGSTDVLTETTQANFLGGISFTIGVTTYCTSTSALTNKFTVQGTGTTSHRVSNSAQTVCFA
jgi:Fibronectin type III domain